MFLFDPCRDGEACSAEFLQVQRSTGYEPARWLAEQVFAKWPRNRTEFARDFRGAGFSARLWELALFGYFSERDYHLDVSHEAPDFLATKDGVTVAVEATTTNPPRNALGKLPRSQREALPHLPEDPAMSEAELILQLAKALRQKTVARIEAGKPYWGLPQVAGRPFVVAVEAFHGETALFHGDSGLASYLFGYRWKGEHLRDGTAQITAEPLHEHSYGGKTIPSGFFAQPDMENVSAVLFSNAATISQFERIGVEHGRAPDGMTVIRYGTCLDLDPKALVPKPFSYVVEAGKHRETFATGIRVLHNPGAANPVPRGFFSDVVEMRLRLDGIVETTAPDFVPFASVTNIYVGSQGSDN